MEPSIGPGLPAPELTFLTTTVDYIGEFISWSTDDRDRNTEIQIKDIGIWLSSYREVCS